MKGFPKHLNTKQDYIFVRENFPPEQWQPVWKELLESELNWFCTDKLANASAGLTDATHKVVESVTDDGQAEYYQYELRTDRNSKMQRLGFTVEEVKAALNG